MLIFFNFGSGYIDSSAVFCGYSFRLYLNRPPFPFLCFLKKMSLSVQPILPFLQTHVTYILFSSSFLIPFTHIHILHVHICLIPSPFFSFSKCSAYLWFLTEEPGHLANFCYNHNLLGRAGLGISFQPMVPTYFKFPCLHSHFYVLWNESGHSLG